jgi:membrane protein
MATKRSRPKRGGVLAFAKTVYESWVDDRAPKMAAALAYYTAFAVAPVLLVGIAMAGLLFGADAARGRVVDQISGLVGQKGAEVIQEILVKAWQPGTGLTATILGIAAFLVAATGLFGELQDSLNQIWKVRKRPGRGILGILKDRFLSMTMVLGMGFILLVSLVLTAALHALSDRIVSWAGEGILLKALAFLVSFGLVTFLFAAMFKVLPDARTRWRDVFVGATLTALLFTVGKFLIGLYLGKSTVGSTFGAAGSFVVFLIWVNYSAQILFLGAEFTKAYADRYGTAPKPDSDAVTVVCPPLNPTRRAHA